MTKVIGISVDDGTVVQISFILPVYTGEYRIGSVIIEDACGIRINTKEVLFGLEMLWYGSCYLSLNVPRCLYDSLVVTKVTCKSFAPLTFSFAISVTFLYDGSRSRTTEIRLLASKE